jgi:hypothetical protein
MPLQESPSDPTPSRWSRHRVKLLLGVLLLLSGLAVFQYERGARQQKAFDQSMMRYILIDSMERENEAQQRYLTEA